MTVIGWILGVGGMAWCLSAVIVSALGGRERRARDNRAATAAWVSSDAFAEEALERRARGAGGS